MSILVFKTFNITCLARCTLSCETSASSCRYYEPTVLLYFVHKAMTIIFVGFCFVLFCYSRVLFLCSVEVQICEVILTILSFEHELSFVCGLLLLLLLSSSSSSLSSSSSYSIEILKTTSTISRMFVPVRSVM